MRFEWNEEKNSANIAKHGISFDMAERIFDGFVMRRIDTRFEYSEVREVSIGMIADTATIVVVHTDRNGVCRIISARQANKSERTIYEKTLRHTTDT